MIVLRKIIIMWRASVLTLFPEMFPGPLEHSLSGRGLKEKIWSLDTVDMRDFATDKHHTADDSPFGGGAGMVIKPDIVDAALTHATSNGTDPRQIVFLTPRGTPLRQPIVRNLMETSPHGLIMLCGRYEGIDHRVIEKWQESHNLIEISIGDYILSGGEMAALTLMDSCVRLLPGIVHTVESLESESFELDLLEFSHYTRPHIWHDKVVPEILLSGNHKKIAQWRQQQAEQITKQRRPDLWEAYLNKHSSNQR